MSVAAENWRRINSLQRENEELRANRPKTTPASLFYDGLMMELPKAAAEGRLEDWTRCSESIAKLLASHAARTASLPPGEQKL